MAKARKKIPTKKGKTAASAKRKSRVAAKRGQSAARAPAAATTLKKKGAVAKKRKTVKARPKRPARSTAASRAYAVAPKFVESGEDLEMSTEGEGMPAGVPAVGA